MFKLHLIQNNNLYLYYNIIPYRSPLNPSRSFPSRNRTSPRSTLPAAAEFVRRLATHSRTRPIPAPTQMLDVVHSRSSPPRPNRRSSRRTSPAPAPAHTRRSAFRDCARFFLFILPRLPVTDDINALNVLPPPPPCLHLLPQRAPKTVPAAAPPPPPPCLHLLPQRAPKTVPVVALHLYTHLDRFKDLLRRGSPLEQVPAGAAGVTVGSHALLGGEVDAMICSTILPSKMQYCS
jgi:hypothetical protein